MAQSDSVTHCLELLAPAGRPRARRMFGGHGLYVDDVFIGIMAGERLFLKADVHTRPRFEAAGCEPFTYEARGKVAVLGFWSAPADAMESPALMLPWAKLALQAALAARAAKTVRPRSAPAARRASAKRAR
jgi:DNA transformation protein and related proteins